MHIVIKSQTNNITIIHDIALNTNCLYIGQNTVFVSVIYFMKSTCYNDLIDYYIFMFFFNIHATQHIDYALLFIEYLRKCQSYNGKLRIFRDSIVNLIYSNFIVNYSWDHNFP